MKNFIFNKSIVPKIANKLVSSNFYTSIRYIVFSFCTNKNEDGNKNRAVKLPEEPQNCCMSGCANCVWVAYAEEVAKILNDGGETSKRKILENVKDPNLRAFLMLELSHLFTKKE